VLAGRLTRGVVADAHDDGPAPRPAGDGVYVASTADPVVVTPVVPVEREPRDTGTQA
jgi:hypothetical protein